MILRIMILFNLLLLASCSLSDVVTISDKTNSGSLLGTGTVLTGSIGTGSLDRKDPLIEDLSGSGDVYYPKFTGLETKAIRVKHTTGAENRILFINSEASMMRVVVTFPKNTSNGNLRLSQIVMPDGNMDGPFGTDSTIPLTQSGGYELRFRENMMSGDPWSGDATILVTLLGK